MQRRARLERLLGLLLPAWIIGLTVVAHARAVRVLPKEWDFLSDIIIPRLRIGPYFYSFWIRHLGLMTAAISIYMSAWGIGRLVQQRLFGARHLGIAPLVETIVIPTALGLGCIAYGAFAILAIGFHAADLLKWLFLPLTLHGGVILMRELRQDGSIPIKRWTRENTGPLLLFGALLLVMALNAIMTCVPEINFDSLEYHLAIPQAYLQAGRIVDLPFNLFSKLPLLMSMIYGWGIALSASILDGMYIAKWINFFVGLGVVLAVSSWGRSLSSASTGLGAAVFFASLPMVSYFFMVATADMACIFFVVSSVSAFYLWLIRRDRGYLLISAVLAGFALSTKYIAAFGVAPLWITVAYRSWKESKLRDRRLLVFTALAIGPLVPWWFRNVWFGYSPVFPVVGGPTFEAGRHESYLLGPLVTFIKDSLTYYPDPSKLLGPLFLAGVPLVYYGRKDPLIRRLAAYCLIGAAVGCVATLHLRYFAQLFPVAALVIALSIRYYRQGRRLMLAALAVVCLCNVAWTASFFLFLTIDGLGVATGQMRPEAYLRIPRNLYPAPSFGAFEALRSVDLAKGARVLLIGDPRPFYSPYPALAGSAYDSWPIIEWARRSETPDQLIRKLDDQHFGAIVFNRSRYFRVLAPEMEGQRVQSLLAAMSDKYLIRFYEDSFTIVFLRNNVVPPAPAGPFKS